MTFTRDLAFIAVHFQEMAKKAEAPQLIVYSLWPRTVI